MYQATTKNSPPAARPIAASSAAIRRSTPTIGLGATDVAVGSLALRWSVKNAVRASDSSQLEPGERRENVVERALPFGTGTFRPALRGYFLRIGERRLPVRLDWLEHDVL